MGQPTSAPALELRGVRAHQLVAAPAQVLRRRHLRILNPTPSLNRIQIPTILTLRISPTLQTTAVTRVAADPPTMAAVEETKPRAARGKDTPTVTSSTIFFRASVAERVTTKTAPV